MRELSILAAFVHGGLAFGHALGVFFNLKRKNRIDVVIHSVALIYDVRSLIGHVKDARDER